MVAKTFAAMMATTLATLSFDLFIAANNSSLIYKKQHTETTHFRRKQKIYMHTDSIADWSRPAVKSGAQIAHQPAESA